MRSISANARLKFDAQTTDAVEIALVMIEHPAHNDRLQAVTGSSGFAIWADADFDGRISDVAVFLETAACIPAGVYDYWIEPFNSEDASGPLSGPINVTIN